MKSLSTFRSAAAILSTLSLTSCGGGLQTLASSGQNATISISSSLASVPANGSVVLTAATTGTTNTPVWTISTTLLDTTPGTLSSNSGTTVTYTAPATPPLYNVTAQNGSGVQGIIVITANVTQGFGGASAQVTLPITAASVTTGISPATASMALGATMEFFGYAVGNTNNGLTWQVNGVTSGSAPTGTVVNTGYYPTGGGAYVWPGTYTAPSTLPMSGSTVTVTAVSAADPTKSSSATITLH
jgi:hypothetical protein